MIEINHMRGKYVSASMAICVIFIILEKQLTAGEGEQLIHLERKKSPVFFVQK